MRFPTVELDEHVVMPNHFHGIALLTGTGASLSQVISSFKSLSSFRINLNRQTRGIPVCHGQREPGTAPGGDVAGRAEARPHEESLLRLVRSQEKRLPAQRRASARPHSFDANRFSMRIVVGAV
jgi:hypothetical protein